MTQTPSPQPRTSETISKNSRGNATDNGKPSGFLSGKKGQQWSLKHKAMALALSVSVFPVLAVGTATYLGGLVAQQQGSQVAQAQNAVKSELDRQRQVLLISTLVTALWAGAIATLFMNRALRQVLNAAASSTTVVNRLCREEMSIRDRADGKDELVALEANLRLIEDQLPELLWKQEAATELSQLLISISHQIWGARSEEDVLRTAVEEVRQVFKTDRVSVFRFDANWDGTFVAESVASGLPKALWSTIHDDCFTTGYVKKYLQGRVRAIDNIYQAGLNDCHIGLLERFAVKANLIAPIITNNQLYGLFIAHQCSGPRLWQQPEIDLFSQLASQVGFALEHAKLLEQVDEKADRRQVFIDITRSIRASLHEEDILKATVEETRKELRTDRVIVFGFDENWYGTVLAESVLPGFPKALRANIKDPCFAEGYVEQYQAGRVQATNNIYEAGLSPCHIGQLEPFAVKANLVAPILKDDKLLGLLIAHQCSEPRNWQQVEIDLFAQVAAQAGFALDHARLIHQIEQAYQAAETTSIQQYHQNEALQYQVSELLRERQMAIQNIAEEASKQMGFVQGACDRIQVVANLVPAVDATVQQLKLERQEVERVIQTGQETIDGVTSSVITIQQAIVKAAEKIELIDEISQNLSSTVMLVSNTISELNLQAMNVALKATRNSTDQERIALADKVLCSMRQLKWNIEETECFVAKIQVEIQEAFEAIGMGAEQVTAGTQLVEAIQEKFDGLTNIDTQMNLLLEEMTQATYEQIQAFRDAEQMILEIAGIVNDFKNIYGNS
ncbi:GAF domain-containing protein [Scytonema sp. UIC 10036]|uniref:GAF domain-containing protein n=1 Tax=Scytonema sp. UIC 10036 TaxID=2304196 RepID=UPI0012DA2595|nr:GAF domain-containing protein [Scytonema sp. UIC 10036]MUG94079.1 GAF domain-containing protein [Scytonema sp. UIC 10036]